MTEHDEPWDGCGNLVAVETHPTGQIEIDNSPLFFTILRQEFVEHTTVDLMPMSSIQMDLHQFKRFFWVDHIIW